MIIKRDIIFNEKATWDWKVKKVKKNIVTLDEEIYDVQNEENENEDLPQTSPSISPSPTSSSRSSPNSTHTRMGSLSDIYATCNFCMTEPKTYKEAIYEEV